jgi:cytochrome c nitrite reductase small subunit
MPFQNVSRIGVGEPMSRIVFFAAIAAAVIALGLFIYVTDAPAYAGTNPSTCNNCHAMDSEYENWYHAGHAEATTCVECHLPHDNPVAYWVAKAKTGMHDVYVFSTGQTPVLIRAKAETKQTIQANCIRCHGPTVEEIVAGAQPFDRYCWDCHRTVAHGGRGISIAPYQDAAIYPSK